MVVGDNAHVPGRMGCAHGSTQIVSQRNDILLEGLAVLQCPAAGDDHFGGGEFRTFTLDDFRTDEAGNALAPGAAPASTAALPPSRLALSKAVPRTVRSDARRVGNGCVRTCNYRLAVYSYKKKTHVR